MASKMRQNRSDRTDSALKPVEARLHLDLLGGFSIRSGTEPLQLPTRKAEALLAYLATQPTRFHSREKLASMFWSGSGDEQARQSLRQTLSAIRKAVPQQDLIVVEGDRIGINRQRLDTDVEIFHSLAKQTTTLEDLERASDLARGEFLEGLSLDEAPFDAWLYAQREQLREATLTLNTALLERLVSGGRTESAIQLALRILEIDPLRESVHRTLMQLYASQGRREAAVKQYHTCAEILRRRLSIEPDAATRKLFRELGEGAEAPLPEVRKAGISVLLVEDNTLYREVMRAILASPDFELTVAVDGPQALLALGKRNYDLILLDVGLPTLDGLTILEVIRQNQITTPVIVLTAYQNEDVELRALELGAADFMRKPVQKAVLLKRIERALASAQATGK
jgi:DNA-binding SARP family transcriptional activator